MEKEETEKEIYKDEMRKREKQKGYKRRDRE